MRTAMTNIAPKASRGRVVQRHFDERCGPEDPRIHGHVGHGRLQRMQRLFHTSRELQRVRTRLFLNDQHQPVARVDHRTPMGGAYTSVTVATSPIRRSAPSRVHEWHRGEVVGTPDR